MEVEAKVELKDLEEIKKKLISLGAKFFKEKKQDDIFFYKKGAENKVQGPGDFVLRIRESDKNTFTFKALTDRTGFWVEHETEISSPREMKIILEKTGFVEMTAMHKKRIPGELGEFELCLDDVKELGKFLEVALESEEGEKSERKLVDFLKKLEFDEKEIIHKGYGAMMFAKLGIKFDGTG